MNWSEGDEMTDIQLMVVWLVCFQSANGLMPWATLRKTVTRRERGKKKQCEAYTGKCKEQRMAQNYIMWKESWTKMDNDIIG